MIWPGVGTFLGAAGCFRLRSGRIVEEILNSTNPLHRTLALDRNFSRLAKNSPTISPCWATCAVGARPRPLFSPGWGRWGYIFATVSEGEREEWREGVFRGDYPGTAIGCCPFLWFCRFSFSVLNTKNVVLF